MDLRDYSNMALVITGALYLLVPIWMIIKRWYVWPGLVMIVLAHVPIITDLVLYDDANGGSGVLLLFLLAPAFLVLGIGLVVRLFLIGRAMVGRKRVNP